MNRLFEVPKLFNLEEIRTILDNSTIFDKIEFSGITREQVREKLDDLRGRQVPERRVLLEMDDEKVAEYWFKNWLHPKLKHAVKPSPKDKRGCSRATLERDAQRDAMCFYENGQQNYNYTLADVEAWLALEV